jgi:hypothetical protein
MEIVKSFYYNYQAFYFIPQLLTNKSNIDFF